MPSRFVANALTSGPAALWSPPASARAACGRNNSCAQPLPPDRPQRSTRRSAAQRFFAMPFSELGLSDKVVSAVAAAGYTEPTPIQAQAIPHVLARRDVLG